LIGIASMNPGQRVTVSGLVEPYGRTIAGVYGPVNPLRPGAGRERFGRKTEVSGTANRKKQKRGVQPDGYGWAEVL
jgi:hypothetical protein